ncbi:MAG: LptF/LptG family permease [Bacteroidota bacterium]|nr:LptF/LptG family permease [Candidatus Kapabacteria bacterium]MCS7302247.1 LptF/LptG family permease [Candidatus Kapabacteria bacterium]MCX7937336.1 LptF/LptG family permease [Chlorobiota bacterium]MDW8074867.1 LptF/LptG family permease [Bacteroidota bacterium]MDW8271506.1 LptF/LptG family permease [Bacteroidota bacterium]
MRILDRYILRGFVVSMAFALLAFSLVFIVVNLIESLDKFIDRQADAATVILYYFYYLPEIFKLLVPITVLVSALFVVGKMTDNYETTAMKSAGVSLYRSLLPLVILSGCIATAHLYFNGWIVPRALSKKFAIERQYFGRNVGGIQEQLYGLYLRDTPTRVVTIGFYDVRAQSGTDITIEEYTDPLLPRTYRYVQAQHFGWDSVQQCWMGRDCIVRTITAEKVVSSYHPQLPLALSTSHQQLATLQRSLEEMTFPERSTYITFLQNGGRNTRQLDIAQAGDYAFPFANIIVILIAVPFAWVKKRSGLAANIAAAMSITFLYLVLTKVSQAVGSGAPLAPALVGWSANIVFLIVGIIILARTPT